MVRRCVKKSSGQEYAAKIINTKKLSARGTLPQHLPVQHAHTHTHTSADTHTRKNAKKSGGMGGWSEMSAIAFINQAGFSVGIGGVGKSKSHGCKKNTEEIEVTASSA